jgi:hypothetical protein
MTSPVYTRALGGLAAALWLGAAACSSDPAGTSNTSGNLTPAQVAELGTAASDEVAASVSALPVSGPEDPFGAFAASGPQPFNPSHMAGHCPAVSPNPIEDPDNDHVPTLLTLTWDPDICTFSFWRHGSFTIFGTWSLADPFPTTPGWDRDATIDNLGWTRVFGSDSVTETRNGTRSVRGTSDNLTGQEDITTLRHATGKDDATLHRQGSISFSPDQGLQLVFGDPIPSGSISIDGSLAWTRGANSFEFDVTTATPLHYNVTDPACAAVPPRLRIDAGELDLTRTRNGVSNGTLKITWSACGQEPTKEFVPAA